MAKRTKKSLREENISDFAGPDAEKEAIEKLAESAKKANAKTKNVGEISDETVKMHENLILAAELEWHKKRDDASVAQGVYRNRLKVAKSDGMDVDAFKKAAKEAKRTAGEVIAEQRNIGRYLRIMGSPLGTQWSMFDGEEAAETIDPAAQGEQAGLNGEPRENNPHTAGTTPWFMWGNGWQLGQDKLAETLGRGNGESAAEAASH